MGANNEITDYKKSLSKTKKKKNFHRLYLLFDELPYCTVHSVQVQYAFTMIIYMMLPFIIL